MTCEPYVGFTTRMIACRFIAFWDDTKVSLGYRIEGLEHTTDDISDEFQKRVTNADGIADMPVFLGTFERAT